MLFGDIFTSIYSKEVHHHALVFFFFLLLLPYASYPFCENGDEVMAEWKERTLSVALIYEYNGKNILRGIKGL